MDSLALLERMRLIRRFEAALSARADHGFQLYSSGQEAVAVGLAAALSPNDQLLCSGRSIGPALARGLDPGRVMAELLGRRAGPSRGIGGRGHLAAPGAGFFGAHAVVGGNLSIAAGVALAASREGRGAIVACLFGDGACGAGALHETLNLAARWRLPLLFVCDNNQISVTTPAAQALAPARLADLARPFGMPAETVDGMDVLAVKTAADALAARARAAEGPAFLECVSERFASHSTGTRETRAPEVMTAILARCPIRRLEGNLLARGEADEAALFAQGARVEEVVAAAVAFAEASPPTDPGEALALAR